MVTRYSTEPGPRLGAIDCRAVGLRVVCGRCKDTNVIPLGEALRLWGVRGTLRDVACDLKCKRCSGKDAEVSIEGRALRVVGE